jgi:hypothetical protein
LLHRSYPCLARPPLGLAAEELLGAVIERLLRALRQTRPETVRGFFALAGKHMRWELNDLARRLDEQGAPVDVHEFDVAAPESNDAELGAGTLLDTANTCANTAGLKSCRIRPTDRQARCPTSVTNGPSSGLNPLRIAAPPILFCFACRSYSSLLIEPRLSMASLRPR